MPFETVQYTVRRTAQAPALDSAGAWAHADVAPIGCFHTSSSDHRPCTHVRMLHDGERLFVQFSVADRYVRSMHTRYQDSVCQDSCVEFFVQPKPGRGYFNFELNCGGAMLLMYIEDPTCVGGSMRRYSGVWPEHAGQIQIHHTMPTVVEQEIGDPVSWRLAMTVPLKIFEHYVGPLLPLNGHPWRGNFYKCADGSSHPHWASWAPMNGYLNFHQPQYFGTLLFER